jgi:N-acetylglutamate synthase-like GNAT family acetyltransferase
MILLRTATRADQARIVAHIRAAQINPLDLKWQHFVLAVDDASGALAGTVQIKTHGDGSRELASLAVASEWQGQGVARRLVEHMLTQNPGPLYLTCRSTLEPLYVKFGFQSIPPSQMPRYFRRLFALVKVVRPLMRRDGSAITLLVMKRDA